LYADNDFTANLSLKQLKNDFILCRKSTLSFFSTLDPTIFDVEIKTNVMLSLRILGWLISGHGIHHLNVINERYLSQL